MPFKVKFQIFESGKQAPDFTTYDARLAKVEYRARCNKLGCALTRMTTDIECIDLTKPEKYVWLVYCVRKAIRKYYGEGRKHEDLMASLDLEKQLDNWNTRTRFHLETHPKCRPDDEKAFAFFQIVEKWRNAWHKYFAYKKQPDKDPAIEREMKKQCFDFEIEIDKYVNMVIGL